MRQYLEQQKYQSVQEFEEDCYAYNVGDLEFLSASALYLLPPRPLGPPGPLLPPGPLGIGPLKRSAPLDFISPVRRSAPLTIRPLGDNSQLHIHEGIGGIAHIKTRDGSFHHLNSYDAAMLDLRLDTAGIKRIYLKALEDAGKKKK